MNTDKEGISIILPVFNCEKYIKDSVNSILKQSYKDFELIIINDGSNDRTAEIINSFNDRRIKYHFQQNQGLSKSINKGIGLAKYKYIARQDADDISLPLRLEKQIKHMKSNPKCYLLGTWAQIIHQEKLTNRYLIHPTSHSGCIYKLLFDCCFTHTSVMIRKSIFEETGLFNEDNNKVPPVDYEMFSRISKISKVENIPEVLVYFRENPSSISFNKPYLLRKKAAQVSINNIIYFAGKDNHKIATTTAEIYYQLNNLSYTKINFKNLKSVMLAIINKIERNENKKNELTKDLNIFIYKLKLKWLINHTFLKYIYILVSPFIKFIEKLRFTNIMMNLLKKHFKNHL